MVNVALLLGLDSPGAGAELGAGSTVETSHVHCSLPEAGNIADPILQAA